MAQLLASKILGLFKNLRRSWQILPATYLKNFKYLIAFHLYSRNEPSQFHLIFLISKF